MKTSNTIVVSVSYARGHWHATAPSVGLTTPFIRATEAEAARAVAASYFGARPSHIRIERATDHVFIARVVSKWHVFAGHIVTGLLIGSAGYALFHFAVLALDYLLKGSP